MDRNGARGPHEWGYLMCLAFSRTSLVRLWRDWHSEDLPDRLFFADGGRIGSCDGMAENQVGQHLARSGQACGTQYGGPDVLRPHYGTHSSHSLFHRGIWNRTGHSSGCLSHLLHPEVANLRAR